MSWAGMRGVVSLAAASVLQQRLRLLQIARVEAFGEPAVDGSKKFARLLHPALVAPEAREAHCGAQFPRFCLLLTGDGQSALEILIRFCRIPLRRFKWKEMTRAVPLIRSSAARASRLPVAAMGRELAILDRVNAGLIWPS
jgi:hypothetical protein